MASVFDCMVSALIQAQKRTELQNEVDKAVDNLIRVAKSGKDTADADEELNDKVGCLMNEQFELGIRCGIQLMMHAMGSIGLNA